MVTELAQELCCDKRGFAGGDSHSIMNNQPPTAAHTMHTRAHLQHTHTHIKYMFYSNPIYESALYEAAQPSAAHAWLLRQAHADCMSSSISMLQAWSCGYTASLSLPLSTSLLCFPLSFMSYLHLVLSAHLPGRADSRSHPPSVQSRS